MAGRSKFSRRGYPWPHGLKDYQFRLFYLSAEKLPERDKSTGQQYDLLPLMTLAFEHQES
jgi:hypothetical protein